MARIDAGGGYGTSFYVKPKNTKPGIPDYPSLDLQQKVDGEYKVIQTVGALTGYITSIEKVDKTAEINGVKKRIRGVKFCLHDPVENENYYWDLTYANHIREFLNRLASLDSFLDKLKISFYRGDKGFVGTSVQKVTLTGNEKVPMKYAYEEHIKPRVKSVELNGEIHKDYNLVDEFMDKLIENVLSKYNTIQLDKHFTPTADVEPNYDESQDSAKVSQLGNIGVSHTDIDPLDLPF